ncbi:MAG: hypothetical protein ABH878_10785, partial [bacterium]
MRRRFITLTTLGLLCLLLVAALQAYAEVQQEWVARYVNTGDDKGLAIDKDIYGNVYIGGYIWNGSTYGTDYFAAKYDINGRELWHTIIQNAGNDTARAILVYGEMTSLAGVYVGGERRVGSFSKFCVVKLDLSDGHVIWTALSVETGNDFKGYDIGANSSGVFITGEGWFGSGILAESDLVTYKFAHSDGDVLAEAIWDGTPATPGNDYGIAIYVDTDAVYVAGCGWIYTGLTPSTDVVVIKYDNNLNELWDYTHDRNAFEDILQDITKAGSYVYVTGEADGILTQKDYVTIKLSASNGSEVWIRYYDCDGERDAAKAIAHYDNYIYVTGESKEGTNFDYATIKYACSNGNEMWVERYDPPYLGDDYGKDIDVNQYGVFVGGSSEASSSGYSDIATVAYQHDGSLLW